MGKVTLCDVLRTSPVFCPRALASTCEKLQQVQKRTLFRVPSHTGIERSRGRLTLTHRPPFFRRATDAVSASMPILYLRVCLKYLTYVRHLGSCSFWDACFKDRSSFPQVRSHVRTNYNHSFISTPFRYCYTASHSSFASLVERLNG